MPSSDRDIDEASALHTDNRICFYSPQEPSSELTERVHSKFGARIRHSKELHFSEVLIIVV
jgi:hypothetical protein